MAQHPIWKIEVKALKRGDKDKSKTGLIRIFQNGLQNLGFNLPKYGDDGDVGTETIRTAANYALSNKIVDDDDVDQLEDYVPESVVMSVLDNYAIKITTVGNQPKSVVHPDGVVTLESTSKQSEPNLLVPWVLDGTKLPDPKLYAKNSINPIGRIDTICIHQMACDDGRSNVEAYTRWKNLAIHAVVTSGPNARGVVFQPLDRRLAHGHGWNNRSVGIEFEGMYAGLLGADGKPDMRTFWRPKDSKALPMRLSPESVEAGKQLIRWIVSQIAARGGKIKYIGSHRQSYSTKSSDPGQEIWSQVVVPMLEELGLQQAPTLPGGSPNPEGWDSTRNKGVPYR